MVLLCSLKFMSGLWQDCEKIAENEFLLKARILHSQHGKKNELIKYQLLSFDPKQMDFICRTA